MKKVFIYLSIILIANFSFPVISYAAISCEEKADTCYERCDENWQGNTIFDGAGRAGCKSGCALAEAGCIIGEWLS